MKKSNLSRLRLVCRSNRKFVLFILKRVDISTYYHHGCHHHQPHQQQRQQPTKTEHEIYSKRRCSRWIEAIFLRTWSIGVDAISFLSFIREVCTFVIFAENFHSERVSFRHFSTKKYKCCSQKHKARGVSVCVCVASNMKRTISDVP